MSPTNFGLGCDTFLSCVGEPDQQRTRIRQTPFSFGLDGEFWPLTMARCFRSRCLIPFVSGARSGRCCVSKSCFAMLERRAGDLIPQESVILTLERSRRNGPSGAGNVYEREWVLILILRSAGYRTCILEKHNSWREMKKLNLHYSSHRARHVILEPSLRIIPADMMHREY